MAEDVKLTTIRLPRSLVTEVKRYLERPRLERLTFTNLVIQALAEKIGATKGK
jgi:hypothetical protein